MPKLETRLNVAVSPDPQLHRSLRLALSCGVALVVLLPMARGHSEWLGWLPLWLVGMPGMALWALHRFRLPLGKAASGTAAPRRRRPGTQARRRAAPLAQRLPRAA